MTQKGMPAITSHHDKNVVGMKWVFLQSQA